MRISIKPLLCMAILLCISHLGKSQILKSMGNRVKQKVEQRTDQKKGESQPADKNTTLEGKANNRRVEFIKL